jgi:transposase-like protein
MTKSQAKPAIAAVNELFAASPDGLREIVRAVMQEMLETEMTDALGAEKARLAPLRLRQPCRKPAPKRSVLVPLAI